MAHSRAAHHGRTAHAGLHHASAHRGRGGARVIQCVAFARAASDVALSGNARDWWYNARGIYARGQAPEPGSVLSFAPTSRMRLGHVAVVSQVMGPREITIDQSHWASRGVSRDVRVVDVSENNDWTAVRVQMGRTGPMGSIYPTHGFIYPRPDDGHAPRVIEARATSPAASAGAVEVAEAPTRPVSFKPGKPLDLSTGGLLLDAPDRTLR